MASTTQPKRRRNASQFSAASRTAMDDAASMAPSSLAGSDYEDDDAYRMKRSRNNAAVRKSRERSKGKAENAERHLIQLRKENQQLSQREKQLKEELELLKESFMRQMTEHLQRSRAYDAVVNGANDDDDSHHNEGPPAMFLSGDQLCLLGGVEKGFSGTVATVIPASTAAAIQKDDAAGHVASIAVGVTGRGVIDLRKEKQLWKNNGDLSGKNAFI